MISRTRMGPWSVDATAARLADLHGALIASVHCLAAWIIAEPQLETKITYSYHLYEQAHLADLIGQRIDTLTAERPQVPRPHNRALMIVLNEIASLETREQKIAGLYHTLLPLLLSSMEEHIAKTNPVADEPTVRVLYQASETLQNQMIWGSREDGDEPTLARLKLYLTESGGLHGPSDAQYDGPTYVQPKLVDVPARDDRFLPLEPGKKMPKAKPLQTPEGRIRLLHIALINLEIPAIEVCCRMIAEFPEAPWEMKMDLAAQIWDEARHAQMCADRLQELGGTIGQFPYHHKVWEHSVTGPTLAERFVTTQRIHEGNGLDQTLMARDALAEVGDMETSQIMDYIMADEVMHVRGGNKWLDRFTESEEERSALLKQVEERLGLQALGGPPLNVEGRRKAGFTEIELDWLADFRSGRRK